MKSELTHLLHKLAADYPDFTQLTISRTGVSVAARQHGLQRFETLDALEAYAWPQVGRDVPSAPSVGCNDPLPPSAQDARAASALECARSAPLSDAQLTTLNSPLPTEPTSGFLQVIAPITPINP